MYIILIFRISTLWDYYFEHVAHVAKVDERKCGKGRIIDIKATAPPGTVKLLFIRKTRCSSQFAAVKELIMLRTAALAGLKTLAVAAV